jgi:hypothetical protein
MNIDKDKISRREFLKIAAVVGGLVIAGGGIKGSASFLRWFSERNDSLLKEWRLNPAFRVNELSANAIELYTHLGTGELLKHTFSGLEADIFRLLAQEQPIINHLPSLAQRNRIAINQCREKVLAALRSFKRSSLVYTGEKMLVKIVEVS